MRLRIVITTTLLAGFLGFLSTSASTAGRASTKAIAASCANDERYDSIQGFASAAAGARFTWTYHGESIDHLEAIYGGHMNQVIWIGADNQNPQTTWVEVGVIVGQGFNGVIYDTPRFYAARGFSTNQTDFYPLSNAPSISANTTHTVGAYNDGSGFHIQIDGATYLNLPTPGRYTTEYDTGFEARPAQGICSEVANRFYVSKLQSYRASDGAWIQSDHGTLTQSGSGNGAVEGAAWCSQPFTFRAWYQPTNGTTLCS